MEIATGVHLIPVAAYTVFGIYAPNIYGVIGEKAVIIDTGYNDNKLAAAEPNTLDRVVFKDANCAPSGPTVCKYAFTRAGDITPVEVTISCSGP